MGQKKVDPSYLLTNPVSFHLIEVRSATSSSIEEIPPQQLESSDRKCQSFLKITSTR